jgi:hypothetical protein
MFNAQECQPPASGPSLEITHLVVSAYGPSSALLCE